ncbi:hypothetical protein SAMN04488009_0487 [Maribacter sedimenticola]|uniref:Uncharacterized protein n=1 Tax=Maribacter sedimenticola TaxID=228956 RepID=A0ABY1SDD7_9FLAO|nr:hypothetical protein [Maribacter sedimenticola]SNR26336.1 hypothetical protein SAMN04488009_0487 [Maribacter sedimenticola]
MRLLRNNWFWNIILVLTLIICAMVLAMHFKNWIGADDDGLNLRSGFYRVHVPYQELDSVLLVDRIPPMQRINGFSALEKEKGIFREFKDSLTNKRVHVFVDNIGHQKIKLVYRDSVYIYLNLKDSVETIQLMNNLSAKIPNVE